MSVTMAESAETLEHPHTVEAKREGVFVRIGERRVRMEYLLLAAMALMAATFVALYFVLDLGMDDVERWGYAGLFGVTVLRSASVVLPMPGGGVIFASGGVLDPVWGIPAPVLVGLVAGFAESLGELTGYGAGRAGSPMLEGRAIYRRIRAWVEQRAFVTVFAMSFAPPALFDVAGLAAGATRVPLRIFYPAVLTGKICRDIIVATAGYYSFGLVEDWYAEIWEAIVSAASWITGPLAGIL
jgi:uncharacterized membrane protein YdjX (TVP38/TMEM64 family)